MNDNSKSWKESTHCSTREKQRVKERARDAFKKSRSEKLALSARSSTDAVQIRDRMGLAMVVVIIDFRRLISTVTNC